MEDLIKDYYKEIFERNDIQEVKMIYIDGENFIFTLYLDGFRATEDCLPIINVLGFMYNKTKSSN